MEFSSCIDNIGMKKPVGLISSASTEFDSCIDEIKKKKKYSEFRSSMPLNAFKDKVRIENKFEFNTCVEKSPPKKLEFNRSELFPG